MARLVLLVLIVIVVALAVQVAIGVVQTVSARQQARRAGTTVARRKVTHRLPSPSRQLPNRSEIVAFLESHDGVEAYLEPETGMSPASVVLVDDAGQWRRFTVDDGRELRRTVTPFHVPVYDAEVMGYPERMRRRKDPGDGATP